MLTKEQLQRAMPKHMHGKVDSTLVDTINNATSDPMFCEALRENVLGYMSVLQDGKYRITDYVSAVKFNSYRMMGDSNIVAWAKTFPARYQKLKLVGTKEKDIHSHVAMYNKNKLVNAIYEQSLIPTHIINADVFQKAINVQAALMADPDVSPKVRSDAANSLLTHLKRPEAQKVELDVGIKDSSIIDELRQVTTGLAGMLQENMHQGRISVKEVSHQALTLNEKGEEVHD